MHKHTPAAAQHTPRCTPHNTQRDLELRNVFLATSRDVSRRFTTFSRLYRNYLSRDVAIHRDSSRFVAIRRETDEKFFFFFFLLIFLSPDPKLSPAHAVEQNKLLGEEIVRLSGLPNSTWYSTALTQNNQVDYLVEDIWTPADWNQAGKELVHITLHNGIYFKNSISIF